jgi:hypothetical protein
MAESINPLTRVLAGIAACAIAFCVNACGDGRPAGERAVSPTESTTAPTTSDAQPPKPDGHAQRADRRAAAPAPGSGSGRTAGPGDDAGSVAAIVEGMYRDLAAGDAAAVCSVMSTAAREQIAQQMPGGSTEAPAERTCTKSMAAFLDVATRSGTLERTLGATVEDVSIKGSSATVTVSFNGAPGQIVLRKEDGRWRFGPDAVGPRS